MNSKLFILSALLPLFEGCFLEIPHGGSSENITAMRWSPGGSTIYAVREKPFDSAGATHWHYFVEQYNVHGTLLSSVALQRSQNYDWGIYGFTSDCQHLIVANKAGLWIASGDSLGSLVQAKASFESESPSGNIVASDSMFLPVGAPTTDEWYQLTWVGNGTSRVIRHWKPQVNVHPGITLLSGGIFTLEETVSGVEQFSVYDTNLNLLYRTPDPTIDTRAIACVPSLNAVLMSLHTWQANTDIVLIDLNTGLSKKVFDQEIVGTAPDGFHVAYLRDHQTLIIRNLLTGVEKTMSNDWPSPILFSPDASYLCYTSGYPPQIKCMAVDGLP